MSANWMNNSRLNFLHFLGSLSGMQLLTLFWSIAVISVCGVFLPEPSAIILMSFIEIILVIIWFGYPIALYFCFSSRGLKRIIVSLLLLCAIATGFWLSIFNYYHEIWNTTVISILELLLFGVVCFSGASALKRVETIDQESSRPNTLLTAIALFAFPIFGAYIHNRFRLAMHRTNS